MDRKEQFLARLRETFRVEAAEHIDAIRAGLLELERSDCDRGSIVERAFREAHSLKGAARSVSLASVEALCGELESIFAAVKRGEQELSPDALDSLHRALGVLASLCAGPAVASSEDSKRTEEQGLDALRQIGSHKKKPLGDRKLEDTPEPLKAGSQAAASPAAESPTAPTSSALEVTATIAQDTVRTSTQKLNAILVDAEGLVGSKLAAGAFAGELRALATDLSEWNQRRARQTSRLRRSLDESAALSEFLESGNLYTKSLEHSLQRLAERAWHNGLALSSVTDRLLDHSRAVLLQPCSHLLSSMPMIARELAREHGKLIDLAVRGENLEVPRQILDGLKGALLHLLRNSVDHGIERPEERSKVGKPAAGAINISVRTIEGQRVEFTLEDDGRGIDVDKVRTAAVRLQLLKPDEAQRCPDDSIKSLVFHSGLSTSPIITDLSGRGLGLAIVREQVEKLGGTVRVQSTGGAGTIFRMVLPLSVATFRGVFVTAGGSRFVIPTSGAAAVCRIKPSELRTIENRQTMTWAGRSVSVARLRDVLALSGPDRRRDERDAYQTVVLIHSGDREVALLVDEVQGEQEVTAKSLGPQLPRVRNVSGGSIAGSGEVIPILNVADLVESASALGTPSSAEDDQREPRKSGGRLLLAEDSITARTLVKSILEAAGYEVVAAVDGVEALTKLKTESFGLLVSDVDMPRMNGFELTSKIRADSKLRDLPVVLVTALASQKDREYGVEVGANAYIVKSDFDQSNLLEIVQRLL